MELADYLAIVRRSLRLLIAMVLIATGLTAWLTARQPERTEGSITATVYQATPAQTQATTPYQFDSFYTLQGASLYADEVKAMTIDPAFVAGVFAEARAPLPTKRLAQTARLFTVKKQDPATVVIQYDDANYDTVVGVLSSVGKQLEQATAALQANGAIGNVRLDVAPVYVVSYHSSVLLASSIGFVASFGLGLTLIFLVEFARPRRK